MKIIKACSDSHSELIGSGIKEIILNRLELPLMALITNMI
jgi:hypothetical protein